MNEGIIKKEENYFIDSICIPLINYYAVLMSWGWTKSAHLFQLKSSKAFEIITTQTLNLYYTNVIYNNKNNVNHYNKI